MFNVHFLKVCIRPKILQNIRYSDKFAISLKKLVKFKNTGRSKGPPLLISLPAFMMECKLKILSKTYSLCYSQLASMCFEIIQIQIQLFFRLLRGCRCWSCHVYNPFVTQRETKKQAKFACNREGKKLFPTICGWNKLTNTHVTSFRHHPEIKFHLELSKFLASR